MSRGGGACAKLPHQASVYCGHGVLGRIAGVQQCGGLLHGLAPACQEWWSRVQILPVQAQQVSMSRGHGVRVGRILVGLMGVDSMRCDASVHAITKWVEHHPAVGTAALMETNPRDANNVTYLVHGMW